MIDFDDAMVLDENENEKLLKIDNDIFEDWRVLVCNDAVYFLADEQGAKPNTLEDAADYDWYDANEYYEG